MFKNALLALVWFSAGLFTAIGITSYAEPYAIFGIGKGELRHPGYNKWWIQEGYDYTIDQKSKVWNVGLGYKVNKYLRVEGNYHDLGEYHHFAAFMANEDLYNPQAPNLCNGNCDPTQYGYLTGYVTGFSLSVLPTLPITDSISVFGRLGLMRVDARFEARITPAAQNHKGFYYFDFSERRTIEMFGFGVTYKRWSLEVQHMPHLTANEVSGYTSAQNVSVSYRFPL